MMVGPSGSPVALDRLQAQLHALSADVDTYTTDPDPGRDEAAAREWADFKWDLDKRQGEISELMVNNAAVRQHYTKLVPDVVSYCY